MKKITGITAAILAIAIMSFSITACDSEATSASNESGISITDAGEDTAKSPSPDNTADAADSTGDDAESEADAEADAADDAALDADLADELSSKDAPEITRVSGQLVKADGTAVSGGVVYFVFQGRLNEIPHTNPLEKIKTMAEVAVALDSKGSFTLNMKPGNFAMIYDPSGTEAPSDPGPDSMAVMKRLTKEQVQNRIAAIKENATKGLPIENGKLGDAYVIENRFIRPPISNFGTIQLQNPGTVTVKALDAKGELINFPATLRLRGKNGDIMEPHTPSISTRAQYSFHDLMPQDYQVFALGTLPRPGAGDEITTPTVSNDQFVYTGESLTHEVVVELPSKS